jgi:hypothetical protein
MQDKVNGEKVEDEVKSEEDKMNGKEKMRSMTEEKENKPIFHKNQVL